MSPIDWATLPLKKYADFSGRAPRAEYWWYVLLVIVAIIVASTIDSLIGLSPLFFTYGPLAVLVMLATFIPSLAAQVRRLHDTNRSGWWVAAVFVPYAFGLWSLRGVIGAAATMDPNHPDPAAINDLAAQSAGSIGLGSLAMLVAGVLGIAIFVFLCLRGTEGDNKYGADPYAG